jgi:NADPH:quinone reductase-like Zn-dependent oxidoreductase
LPGVVEPEGLQPRRGPIPEPGAGQVLLRMEATGVSFAEQQMRRGRYFDQPAFPFVPGYDVVGTVEAVGDGVDRGLVGTRAAALTKTGGWSSHLLLDAVDLVAVPEGVDPAYFFNIWAGKSLSESRFRTRLHADRGTVLDAVRRGEIHPVLAARLPLAEAAEALRLAESGTVSGKVVLVA